MLPQDFVSNSGALSSCDSVFLLQLHYNLLLCCWDSPSEKFGFVFHTLSDDGLVPGLLVAATAAQMDEA